MEINPQTLMEALKYIGTGLGGAGTFFALGKVRAKRRANGNGHPKWMSKESKDEFQRIYDHTVPLSLCDERHGNLEKKVDHLTTKVDDLPRALIKELKSNGFH